jgi:hypothetical protein
MTFAMIIALLRGVVYLWVAATSFSISQLYRDGYMIAKRESAIISRLISILFWLAVILFYLSISAFAQAFDINAHEVVVAFIPVFILPLGFLLNRFRNESITQNKKPE